MSKKFDVTAMGNMMMNNLSQQSAATKNFEHLAAYKAGRMEEIPLKAIKPNPDQPRIDFDDDALQQLAHSIEEIGLVQPITVRCGDDTDNFYIVAGERRFRAHELLGREKIKCMVVDLNDEDNALVALAENLNRADLHDYEVAKAVIAYQEKFPNKSDYAEILGISRQRLYRLLSFANLPQKLQTLLDDKPSLLSAATSYKLVSLQSSLPSTAETENQLCELTLKGVALIDKEELVPSNLAEWVEEQWATAQNTASAVITPRLSKESQIKRTFVVGGKTIGKVKQNGKKLTVELSNSTLDEQKQAQLFAFLERLLDEGTTTTTTTTAEGE